MGNKNIGEDLALVGVWLTVMADIFAAVGATVLVEPEAGPEDNKNAQKQMDDLQSQLQDQKKQLQKQQIQFQLLQMQLELQELEQQVKERKK
ncbi:MAG: hypothetical protein K0R47_5337 [Brevibacillus sp.]|nr:hypothetical protein [Brevibacillus sp.]